MDVIRKGKISSVNAEAGKCRVVYSDRDNCTTVELPLCVFNNEYAVPEVGDQVTVLHQPNGPASGFILGDYWSETHTTPEHTGQGYRRKDFDRDGKCFWEYGGDSDGELKFHNDDKLKIESKDDVTVESKDGTVIINGKTAVRINSDGSIAIECNGALTIKGGAVTITGNAKIDGITFLAHTHECTAPGTPSGPPQGA